MYRDVVARTQIYLGDEHVALLARVEQETGASRSELIRRAIRRSYGGTTAQDRITALRQTAGSWAGRSQSGADYVDTLRTDLNERLGRLGL
jgi:Arc/MetJ-type ribon-helix-helix transcriptional regulator